MSMEKYTCKYCGSVLHESLFCDFCQLVFLPEDVCHNGQRMSQVIDEIPMMEEEKEILERSTGDFLKEKTVTLFYLLRAARKQKDRAFRNHEDELVAIYLKKIYILENILLEREGVFPKAMSESIARKKRLAVQSFEEYLKDRGKKEMKSFKRN